jgi:peptidoglycan/xylan/chitin deacetylase (PgdA/CDA1 family)
MGTHLIKRNVKIVISLVYFVLINLFRGGLRMIGKSSDGRLVVLYYHGVPAKHRRNFKRQMDALQRGASVLPATYRGRVPSHKKHVAITFDDALDSIVDNALPELASRSFHATIFVPVGSLGRRATWEMFGDDYGPSDAVMPVEQLIKLSLPLVSLGSHTINHPLVSELAEGRMREEIEGSRKLLAELTGRDIRSFSFPYGDYNSSSVAACEAAGYEAIFSILPEEVDTTSSKILRGRTSVDPSDGPIEFFLKFSGGYAWATQIAPVTRRLRSMIALKSGRSLLRQEKTTTS